jgi:ribose transport system ATP-binding protein
MTGPTTSATENAGAECGPAAAPILSVQGVSKRFGPVKAVSQVSMTASVGEVVGLIGENGAGKSTLMSMISGTLTPDEGQILLNGSPITPANYHAASRHGIFRIYQHQALIPTMSVAENVFLGQEARFRTAGLVMRRAMQRRTAGVFGDLGVTGIHPDAPLGRYSFAERQVVEIVRSIAQADLLEIDHPVILLDEPTSALSREQVEFFFDFVQRVKPRAAQVFVSHRLQELLDLSDRVVVLKDGRNVGEVAEPHRATEGELHAMMVGRVAEERFYHEERQRGSGGDTVLKVENLSVDGSVHDVSFELHAGEVLGIGGVIGSGKSDLGRAVAEAGRGATGLVELDGKQLRRGGPRESIRQKIGYVPPERHAEGIIGMLSVSRNIALPQTGSLVSTPWVNGRAERRVAEAAVKQLNIRTHSVNTVLDQLSGGNQQKVVLSRWTSLRSRVLVLDNPTNGIDVGAKTEIYRLIRDLTADGVAVLVMTDDLPELIGLSDRIVIMKDGRMAEPIPTPPGEKPDEAAVVAQMV